MIQVSKLYFNPPTILCSTNCLKKIKKSIEDKNKHSFGYYYNHKEVKEALEKMYHKKCAYCESKTKHVASLQVEHYRPKAEVTEDKKHNGYYWLGYEWSNLLLACPKCNEQGAKGNRFPILGIRILTHSSNILPNKSPLIDEKPLLLNPELDNPKEHFGFTEYGHISFLTLRGYQTIRICKLNREDLYLARKRELIDNIFTQIKNLIFGFESNSGMPNETFKLMLKNIFKQLENRQNSFEEYALLGWYMCRYFDKFVQKHISVNFQETIIMAWEKYKRDEL